jgi:anti-sigma B factor antagonist
MTEIEDRFDVDVDTLQRLMRLSGVLDMATAPMMLDSVHVLGGAETITLDLHHVTFIDAAGLGAIVHLGNELAATGGTLRIVGVRPRQARLFLICGLASLLPHQHGDP